MMFVSVLSRRVSRPPNRMTHSSRKLTLSLRKVEVLPHTCIYIHTYIIHMYIDSRDDTDSPLPPPPKPPILKSSTSQPAIPKLTKRQKAVVDLIQSETLYLKDLRVLVEQCQKPLVAVCQQVSQATKRRSLPRQDLAEVAAHAVNQTKRRRSMWLVATHDHVRVICAHLHDKCARELGLFLKKRCWARPLLRMRWTRTRHCPWHRFRLYLEMLPVCSS